MNRNIKMNDIIVNNVEIPATDTTYWCKVKRLKDIETKKHIVEFEPVIDSEGFVHHMEVFHCATDPHVEIPLYEGDCNDMPDEVRVCAKVMALWAMGAERFTYPEEVGMPLGGHDFNPYIRLEVHYNNPDLISGMVDNSGMRIKYVDKLRKYDAGVMELGLEYTDKMAIPPGVFGFPLSGYCISECTDIALPDNGILVFGSQLHTHTRGLRSEYPSS
jgi:dopamine beta-monooxygenase